jgi:hypothetical protein
LLVVSWVGCSLLVHTFFEVFGAALACLSSYEGALRIIGVWVGTKRAKCWRSYTRLSYVTLVMFNDLCRIISRRNHSFFKPHPLPPLCSPFTRDNFVASSLYCEHGPNFVLMGIASLRVKTSCRVCAFACVLHCLTLTFTTESRVPSGP